MKIIATLLLLILSATLMATELSENYLELDSLTITETQSVKASFFDSPNSGNIFVIEDLEEHGIDSIQDVTKEIPNFNFLDFGMRSFHSVLAVRGLTNTPFFSAPSVVFYVDDIPYGSAFSYANRLFGVESIEVYRGPQGAFFGKNSYGGVVNVKSRKPGNQIKTTFSAEYGSYNSWVTEGYVEGGLIKDTLFFTMGGSFAHSDGYMNNTFLNNNTPDQEGHLSGRGSVLWEPSPNWNISLTVNADNFNDSDAHISSLKSKNPLEIRSNQGGKLVQKSNSEVLRVAYEKDNYQFLSISSRRDWQLNPFFIDADLSSRDFLTLKFKQRQTQWNQEFRIKVKQADLLWTAGAYISMEDFRRDRLLTVFGSPAAVQQGKLDNKSYAIFGNITYNFLQKFRLNTGVRLDYVHKEVDREINSAAKLTKEQNFFYFSPKVSIDYLFSDDMLLYTSTALAFKPGGFSVAAESPEVSEFASESMWASEAGIKLKWPEKKYWANLAVFYYKITDYQVERRESLVNYSIINAPKALSYGVELEAGLELMFGLQLETSLGYTHIRFEQYTDPTTKISLKGKQPPYVPEKNALIALNYKHPAGYFFRTEWMWNDKIYYDDVNSTQFKADGYSTLNARIGYQSNYFDLYLFAENLTNSQYYSFILPSFNAGTPSKPRSLGVKLKLEY